MELQTWFSKYIRQMNVTKVNNIIGPLTREREVTLAISVVVASPSSRLIVLSEI